VGDGDLRSIIKFEWPPKKKKKKKRKKKERKKRLLLIAGSLPAPEIIRTGGSLHPMVRRNPEATVL
jgi:hypothetical protein